MGSGTTVSSRTEAIKPENASTDTTDENEKKRQELIEAFMHGHMKNPDMHELMQEYYDIARCVRVASDEVNLTRAVFCRRGVRYSHSQIMKVYSELQKISRDLGYSCCIEFMADYACIKKEISLDMQSVRSVESKSKTVPVGAVKATEEVEVEHVRQKSRMKNKILKSKKSRHFKELEQKEIDSKFDYFNYKAKHDESGRFTDNSSLLESNPFMGEFFSDLDIEFRKIMNRIYVHNRGHLKDKARWKEEIIFLEEYFENKLTREVNGEISTKRLASAVAYLMKKLQNKIFESNDASLISTLFYFKTRLCLFYNYYRK